MQSSLNLSFVLSLLLCPLDKRDPKKRRVKPVERHLIQLDFGLSDSESDSDFEINEHEEPGNTYNVGLGKYSISGRVDDLLLRRYCLYVDVAIAEHFHVCCRVDSGGSAAEMEEGDEGSSDGGDFDEDDEGDSDDGDEDSVEEVSDSGREKKTSIGELISKARVGSTKGMDKVRFSVGPKATKSDGSEGGSKSRA